MLEEEQREGRYTAPSSRQHWYLHQDSGAVSEGRNGQATFVKGFVISYPGP